ncbi:uncharacterized protein LOC125833534 [Solanum verrucosum]|uniref:uncharacterized protein LOC125833534 n=1 Tax=Solanum verrucosum TaxID=315347 RepID=UPI0020D10D61|nr:uncharacterized protein LOC125833534 [Solanum verrucosum]
MVDQEVPPQAPQALIDLREDPQEFIDEVYKVLDIMGVTSVEKAELAAYQLKGVSQVLPLEMRKAKVLEFISLRQCSMSVKEYALRFTQLSKYAPSIVADCKTKMSKFVSGVSDLVVKECRTTMLFNDMDIARLMIHAQQIKEEKLKGRSREKKRCGKRHEGRCLAGIESCFSCGEIGHKMRNCTKAKTKGREDVPKKNRLYSLQARGDHECAPN